MKNFNIPNFISITDLFKSLPELKQMESFEELSKASLQLQEFSSISSDIESLKLEFNNYSIEYDKLIKKKQKYENTEKSIYALSQSWKQLN